MFINIQNCCHTCSTTTLISALKHNRLDVANEIIKLETYALYGAENAFTIALKHNHLDIAAQMLESPRRKSLFSASTADVSSFELSQAAFNFLYEKVKGFRAKSLENKFLPESLRKGIISNVHLAIQKLVESDKGEGAEKKSGFTRLHLEVNVVLVLLTNRL